MSEILVRLRQSIRLGKNTRRYESAALTRLPCERCDAETKIENSKPIYQTNQKAVDSHHVDLINAQVSGGDFHAAAKDVELKIWLMSDVMNSLTQRNC